MLRFDCVEFWYLMITTVNEIIKYDIYITLYLYLLILKFGYIMVLTPPLPGLDGGGDVLMIKMGFIFKLRVPGNSFLGTSWIKIVK